MREDCILVIRKGRGPYTGYLDLPGGGLEHGEAPEDAVVREFREETGLVVTSLRLLGSYSNVVEGWPEGKHVSLHQIGFVYRVEAGTHGEIKSSPDGQDSLGAVWLPVGDLGRAAASPLVRRAWSLHESDGKCAS